ncbi:MAG: ABC transporter ATP-binding protein [Oscillospiraceae bacterium]|nr:ABC transporter ATP-binding protein [Oscillospiraceae bacterium]
MKETKTKKRSLIGTFLSYFKRHKGLFYLDVGCALLIALIDLAFPLVTRTAMYRWLPDEAFAVFFAAMASVVLAFLLRAFLYYVVGYWGHTFGIRVEADIRRDLFAHMQELGFDFYDRNRTGQLMSRLTTDLFEVTELAHHGPEDLLISVITIVGALAVMFTVRWELALVVTCIIPVLLVVVMRRRRHMSDASAAAKQKTGAINAQIESSLSGARTTKAFANESCQQQRFDQANEVFKTAKRGFHREMGLFFASMEFFVNILSVAVIAVGGWLIMKGRMNYIDLITFNLYVTAFVNPVRKLANFAEMFSSGFAGLRRFAELMDTRPTIQDAPDAAELTDVRGDVEVDHVSFSYDGEVEVLHDVSLHAAPGETIAVVGPSGGGKSTLCQLLPRFYEVGAGAVRVDGHDVRTLTQSSLRRSIGIVQQDVFLFADTVRENIRYGRPDATDEEVEQAARRAEIYDDIAAMPDGFDTYVGERGTLLSGGQKQRVAIARIFLKDPPILILDEATSALDSVTESRIQHAFDQLSEGRTTLIIAHRLSTIRRAGRILVVQDGVIAEQGSHQELMALNGAYARLYRTQQLGVSEHG